MLLKAKDLTEIGDPVTNSAGRDLKCLIIFPPSRRAVRAMYTFHNDSEHSSLGAKPPLGPMFVASYLKQNSSHDVKIIDCQVLGLSDEQIRDEIQTYQPDIVGITAWTDFWYDAWKCIQIAKEVSPEIHVSVGGPHIGIYPEITLENSGCDSVIVGDGEVPFFWLANAISNGQTPENLPGLHFKEHGVKGCEKKFYIHGDLDTLPWPDRTMLPYEKYRSVLSKSDFVTTMITSRGCPYKCTFCKLSFQKALFRSAEDVVNEMEQIAALGIREIEIYDDTFTWSKKRLIEICDLIVERGLDLDWAIRDRVSSPTPETMEHLARAGCRRIHFGIESGSNKTLERIKKSIDVDQAIEAVRLAKQHGIEVLTYFMLGLPGETLEDMQETARFAGRLDPDYATFSVTVPYAGTEMYEEGLSSGVIPQDFWSEYAAHPVADFTIPYFWEEHLNKEELLKIRDEATRRFYFRPKYVFRQLRQTSSPGELWRKGRMALGLFETTVLGKGEAGYLEGDTPATKEGAGYANNSANPYSVRS